MIYNTLANPYLQIKPDGTYYADLPLYPAIKAGHETMNLSKYISMKSYADADKDRFGKVNTTDEFYQMALDI